MNAPYRLSLPIVYVDEPVQWEYRHLWLDLATEPEAADTALNQLGAEGWEVVATFTQEERLCYICKRQRHQDRPIGIISPHSP